MGHVGPPVTARDWVSYKASDAIQRPTLQTDSLKDICLLKRGKEGVELGEWGRMAYLGVNKGGETDQIYFMKKMFSITKKECN